MSPQGTQRNTEKTSLAVIHVVLIMRTRHPLDPPSRSEAECGLQINSSHCRSGGERPRLKAIGNTKKT